VKSNPSFEATQINGLFKITLDIRRDERGWFEEVWQARKWSNGPLHWFRPVQQNTSSNLELGTTRGLHAEPWNKLVTVTSGAAYCAWVDLRPENFGQLHTATLEPGTAYFVPSGVANGYQSLKNGTVYSYLVDDHWQTDTEYVSVNTFDSTLGINWPVSHSKALLSEKDFSSPNLRAVMPVTAARIGIFGHSGQVGSALRDLIHAETLLPREIDPAVEAIRYLNCVINAAAFTSVDLAEEASSRDELLALNFKYVLRLAEASRASNALFVHYSSDYVFDGISAIPRLETELPSPLQMYGITKALGDFAAAANPKNYIIRTSWVYGAGRNFLRTMLSRALSGHVSRVVDDQFGRPTWSEDIALFTKFLIESRQPFGTYNFTSTGTLVSWYEIARLVYDIAGADRNLVVPISSAEYQIENPRSAVRPTHSSLDLQKVESMGYEIPSWKDSLERFLAMEISSGATSSF